MRTKLAIGLLALTLTLPACAVTAPGVVGTSTGVSQTTNIGFEGTNGVPSTLSATFSATPNYGIGSFQTTIAESKYTGTFTVTPTGGSACITLSGSPGTLFTITSTCTANASTSFTVTDSKANAVLMVVNYIVN